MFAGFACAPDSQDRDEELILDHIGLVKMVASHMMATLPRHVEMDDLIQAGTLGLIDAARKYDTSKAVPFPTYAKHRIRGAILDSLRQQDPISRDMRAHQKNIESVSAELEKDLHREATETEIAAAMNMELHRFRMIQVHLAGATTISASTSASEELPDPDHAASPEEWPEAICARMQLATMLHTALAALPERQRELIRFYYVDELSMKEIGVRLHVNESRVSQIHKAAMHSVGARLRAMGVRSAAA